MINNDIIFLRLKNATKIELTEISKILKLKENDYQNINKISEEYRSVAGHSVLNIFRDKNELPYKQIIIDVADKLHNGFGWTHYKLDDYHREDEIEKKIWVDLEYRIEKVKESWDNLSDKEKREKENKLKNDLNKEGYSQTAINSFITLLASGTSGIAVASPIALSIFYSGFFASISASIFGVSLATLISSGIIISSIVALPFGIAIAGTPAYRKTIPITILMIKIAKRIEEEKNMENL